MKIENCPFCKKDEVEFRWQMFPILGRVECKNWKDKCCAHGPQVKRKKYDNEKRMMNRAIKLWNAAKSY